MFPTRYFLLLLLPPVAFSPFFSFFDTTSLPQGWTDYFLLEIPEPRKSHSEGEKPPNNSNFLSATFQGPNCRKKRKCRNYPRPNHGVTSIVGIISFKFSSDFSRNAQTLVAANIHHHFSPCQHRAHASPTHSRPSPSTNFEANPSLKSISSYTPQPRTRVECPTTFRGRRGKKCRQ